MDTFRGRMALLCLILLAFALRVYHLESQSLWSDEGLTLYRLYQPVAAQLQNNITVDGIDTQDTNPPFYFLLLHGWYLLTGDTVFALRYGGVLMALLALPLLYQVTAVVTDKRVGFAAAFLLAISPFHIWETQILRNYGLLITLNLLSLYGLFRFITHHSRPWRWLILWISAGVLGIYTHYFGFFIFAYGLITLVVASAMAYRGQWLTWLKRNRWLGLMGLIGLFSLIPALQIGLERFRAGQQIDFFYYPLTAVIHHALSAFALGLSRTFTHPWIQLLPALLLAFAGGLSLWRRRPSSVWLVLGYQILPLAFLQLLSLVNPLYNGTRHLLIGLPPFLILLASAGLAQRSRWARLVVAGAMVVVIVLQVNWLTVQFSSPELVRDDVRGAALFLNEHAAPNDLIIVHDTLIGFTFDYYYEGAAAWQAIPLYGEQDVNKVIAEMQTAAANTTGRLWFLSQPLPRTGFSTTVLPEWVNDNLTTIWTKQFPHMWLPVRLQAYLPNPLVPALPPDIPVRQDTFANTLALQGLALPATLTTGETGWLESYWSQTGAAAEKYTLSLRWQDETGQGWAQQDSTLNPTTASSDWPQGALFRHDQAITLPASLPPGHYTVWLRLLDAQGTILTNQAGELDTFLGEVTVVSQPIPLETALTTIPPFTAQSARLGPLTLLGYQVPTSGLRPGHVLPLELFWQVRRSPGADYQLRTRLVSDTGEFLSETITPLTRANYPTSQWIQGTVVQGKIALLVKGGNGADEGRVEIALLTAAGEQVGSSVLLDTPLPITPWPLVTDLPPLTNLHEADFGDPPLIHLPGYDLSATTVHPGDVINLTLYWQSRQNIQGNYVVLVHLTGATGMPVAQGDGVPVNGVRLTVSWRENEVLTDEHLLPVGPDVLPGEYQLWVGFYDADTGVRLPVSGTGADSANGRVLLGTITVLAE